MNQEIARGSLERAAEQRTGGRTIGWRRLPAAALAAVVIAAAANAVVYWAARAAGAIPAKVSLPSMAGVAPLTVGVVVMTTIVAMLLATIVFAVTGLVARSPVRVFRVVASVALVFSFALPATVPGPPAVMRLTLVAMHVVAWAAAVGVLATLSRRPSRPA